MYVIKTNQLIEKVDRLIYSKYEFYQRLFEEMNRSQRYKRPLSLTLISVEAPARIHNKTSIANVLNESLRITDIVSGLSKGSIGIIMTETDGDAARTVLQRMYDLAGSSFPEANIRAGLSSFIPDDTSRYVSTEAAGYYMNHVADQLQASNEDEAFIYAEPFYADNISVPEDPVSV